jgi:hypothetical protein
VLNSPPSTNPTLTIYAHDDVVAGETYHIVVTALNMIGESGFSDQIFVIAADMP